MVLFRKIVVATMMLGVMFAHASAENLRRAPTHADAAIIIVKYSGLFDQYVASDATLTECISFLNKYGIYFGLMEVVNGVEFTRKDCARVMGQIELVLTGEAEYEAGKVKLPKGIDSWEGFCILNGVAFIQGYEGIVNVSYPVRD